MAYTQSASYVEIQKLKEELAISQKKADRYAHLSASRLQIFRIELIVLFMNFTVASLSEELDTLRNNICNSCKKKLVSPNLSVSVHTPALSGPSNSASALPSLWRRVFQGRHHSTRNALPRGSPSSLALPLNNRTSSKSLPPVPRHPKSFHTPGPSKLIPSSDQEAISSEPKAELPKWSVEYRSEAKRILELNLENVVTYGVSVYSVKMSPDGHRVAIGLKDGTIYLNDLKTGSNIWLVSDPLVQSRGV